MKKLCYIILGCTLMASCNMKKSNGQEEQEQKVIHDIDKLLEDLPDPAAIPYTLKSIDAEFGDSLVNSLDNLSRYQGNEDKLALNMGVYSADVSYLASYNKPELTMQYVRTCHTIGETLGDSAIFDQDLLDKIQGSLNDDAALSGYLRSMIVETSVQLEKDHHLSMAALALTGSFIEELYQAVNVIENYHDANLSKEDEKIKIAPLVKLVMDQEKPLLDLIELLKDIPHDDIILEMMTHLNILDRLYKGELATIEAKMQEDPNFVIDRDIMFAVTLEIERIRADIIK